MADRPHGAEDMFRTVNEPADGSLLVLGSKFIARVAPSATVAEAEEILQGRQRRYPDATHHCWACRVGRPGPLTERAADAGEPSGTAGRPILDALRRVGLENTVCVVTRYFGGTKLGTGGLARAYADAADAAIGKAAVGMKVVVQKVTIDFDFECTGIVFRALEEFGVHLVPAEYDSRAHGTVRVPVSRVADLERRLAESAHAGVEFHAGELEVV